MRRKARQAIRAESRPRFWGRQAVSAAFANPGRRIVRIFVSREAAAEYDLPADVPVTFAEAADLARHVPRDWAHDGIVAEVERLDEASLADLLDAAEEGGALLVLDQVGDPREVGAILRSAAAFGALGIVTQHGHAPAESGILAAAAGGALETVPWTRVANLARALDEIAQAGFWRVGLSGAAETTIGDALGPPHVALVLGNGMRNALASNCDALARLPFRERIGDLEVSDTAAIALYAATMASART